MSLFNALNVTATGIDAMQTWIDTSSGNLANADDAVPAGSPTYAEQTPVLTPLPDGEGVTVSAVDLGSTSGIEEHDPSSPIANSAGDVSLPSISTSDQLIEVMEAQDGYSADADAFDKAVTAYQAGLQIGN